MTIRDYLLITVWIGMIIGWVKTIFDYRNYKDNIDEY